MYIWYHLYFFAFLTLLFSCPSCLSAFQSFLSLFLLLVLRHYPEKVIKLALSQKRNNCLRLSSKSNNCQLSGNSIKFVDWIESINHPRIMSCLLDCFYQSISSIYESKKSNMNYPRTSSKLSLDRSSTNSSQAIPFLSLSLSSFTK